MRPAAGDPIGQCDAGEVGRRSLEDRRETDADVGNSGQIEDGRLGGHRINTDLDLNFRAAELDHIAGRAAELDHSAILQGTDFTRVANSCR